MRSGLRYNALMKSERKLHAETRHGPADAGNCQDDLHWGCPYSAWSVTLAHSKSLHLVEPRYPTATRGALVASWVKGVLLGGGGGDLPEQVATRYGPDAILLQTWMQSSPSRMGPLYRTSLSSTRHGAPRSWAHDGAHVAITALGVSDELHQLLLGLLSLIVRCPGDQYLLLGLQYSSIPAFRQQPGNRVVDCLHRRGDLAIADASS